MKVYIGVDISKARLDVDDCGKAVQYKNDSKGINKFIRQLKKRTSEESMPLVIVEASGGYESRLVAACQKEQLAIHVAHANKVRYFAKSKGCLAKTDKLDAEILSEYGTVMNCESDEPLSEELKEVKALLGRREQLLADRQREKNRLDKITNKAVKQSSASHIKWLDKEIKKIGERLSECSQSPAIKKTHDLLTSIPSIGDLVASYLMANLPEMGKLNHRCISALLGVAPYNRDSGQSEGKRFIQGGRGNLRRLLYMSAISAISCNADMRAFYQRLKAKGKPSRVAIIAVIRKLLGVINAVIKRQTPWEANYCLKA